MADHVGIINHTSHPHVMSDGTVYNLGMSITSKGPAYNIVRFSPSRITIGDCSFKNKSIVYVIQRRYRIVNQDNYNLLK